MTWLRAEFIRRLSVTALCLAALPIGRGYGCAADRDGNPLLGEHRIAIGRGVPVLLQIQQNDLDVQVQVTQGPRNTLHNGPSGRNGIEWIYLTSPQPADVELCIYAVHGQAVEDSYTIQRLDLTGMSATQRAALRSMSDAGVLWAEDAQSSRIRAIETYQRVAAASVMQFQLSEYAALYAQLARVQRFQYDPALADLRRLAGIEGGSPYVRYMAYWTIGNILNRRADRQGSREAVERALTKARDAQRRMNRSLRRDIADITNLLGEIHLSSGDLAGGAQLIDAARLQSGKDYQLLGHVHNNLGYVELLRADNDLNRRSEHLSLSLGEHFRARHYLQLSRDRRWLSIVENNLASVFERLGDLRKAREHYEEALRLIDKTDDPMRFQVLYRNLGHVYQYLGDYEKAERYLAAATELAERAVPHDAIRLHCYLGTTRRLRNRLVEAIAEHQICHSRAGAARDILLQTEALYELTVDYSQQQRPAQAWTAIQEATNQLPGIHDGDLRSKVLAQLASLLQARGDLRDARARIDEAIAATEGARYPTARIDALAAAMTIYADQGREEQAMVYGFRAIDSIESLHRHLDAERLGPAWSARTHDVYTELAMIMLAGYQEQKKPEKLWAALEVIERSRAISLRQQFSAPASVLHQVEQSPVLATLSEIASEHAVLGEQAGSGELPLAYYHEHDLLTLSRLAGVGDLPVPPPLSPQELYGSLSAGQTVLYYFFSKDRAYLFLITDAAVQLFDLGPRDGIQTLIDRVRESASARSDALTNSLRALSAAILPTTALPHEGEWIVVGDGGLQSIPFGALHVAGRADPYEPAIARYSVRMTPSLSTLFMHKTRKPEGHSVDLAVFADPVFGVGDRRSAVARSEGDARYLGWSKRLERLPSTAREAEQLSKLFAPTRTAVYTGELAVRENLRSAQVRNARVLHIASHGYFQSSSPDNVGFALSTTAGATNPDSGFVTLTELFTYRFNSELVVISGCDTALGLERDGEGMMSLTRGFIAQGASHVLATLWAVSDRASADFMALFYARLVHLGSVREALRAAQQDLRTRPEYREPYFWAPYVLTTVEPDDQMTFSSKPS